MESTMSQLFDCSIDAELLAGMRAARRAIAQGELVVVPTDTVYGVAADAFSPAAVARLLEAKGRTRTSPPPVLIGSMSALDALAESVPDAVRALGAKFWPGGLTIIVDAQPSLAWDLGDTRGTVAVRIPNHPLVLELLAETGPLAVSSANLTGQAPGATAAQTKEQLGGRVSVYLEAGTVGGVASTIVDATALTRGTGGVRIVRSGKVTTAALRKILGDVLEVPPAPVKKTAPVKKPSGGS
jgi:tRNA threonylcarbamoyl adenosine modification protein (Sua5/YciO/YrdC/YwlC family)